MKQEGVKDAKDREETPTKGLEKNVTTKVSQIKSCMLTMVILGEHGI